MSSKKRPEILDLEKDLPTTREDVAALRHARSTAAMDVARYLRALSRLKLPGEPEYRRKTHEGFEPFSL